MRNQQKFWILLGLLLVPMAAWADAFNLGRWLSNVQETLPDVFHLVMAISYVIGLLFIVLGVFKLKAYGQMTVYQSSQASMSGPLIFCMIGVVLFSLPATVDVLLYTFWGYGSEDIPPYPSGSGGVELIGPVVSVIQIIGYISFIRGWLILSKVGTSGTQPGTISKAVTHIIGGIVAINIMGTWEIIYNTMMGMG